MRGVLGLEATVHVPRASVVTTYSLVPTCPGSLRGHPSSFHRGLLGLVKQHFTSLDSGRSEGAVGLMSFAELLCHQPGREGVTPRPDEAGRCAGEVSLANLGAFSLSAPCGA